MSSEGTSKGLEFLNTLIKAHRASEREAMSLASVASYVETGKRMQHDAKRHDAQVDAYLKAKFDACGKPDVYEPPGDDDTMGSTLINCTFNSDAAIKAIGDTIQQIAVDGDGSDETKPEPQPEQPPPQQQEPSSKPWWGRLLGTLGAVALGAGITYGTAKYFAGDSDQYDLRGQFRVPPHLLQEGNQ